MEAELMSEVVFRCQVIWRFIYFDETHLTKSSECDKNGPRDTTFINQGLLRAGNRVFKDLGGYLTGVFGSNPLESMHPIMTNDTMEYKTSQTGLNI